MKNDHKPVSMGNILLDNFRVNIVIKLKLLHTIRSALCPDYQ
jgi:hypothetical protein